MLGNYVNFIHTVRGGGGGGGGRANPGNGIYERMFLRDSEWGLSVDAVEPVEFPDVPVIAAGEYPAHAGGRAEGVDGGCMGGGDVGDYIVG